MPHLPWKTLHLDPSAFCVAAIVASYCSKQEIPGVMNTGLGLVFLGCFMMQKQCVLVHLLFLPCFQGEVPATTIISPHIVLLQHLPSHIPFKSSSFEGGRGVEYMALPRDLDLGAQHITCSSVKSLYLCRLWTGCHRESRSLPLLYQFTHKTPIRVWHLGKFVGGSRNRLGINERGPYCIPHAKVVL